MTNAIAPPTDRSYSPDTDPLLLTATLSRLSNTSLSTFRERFADLYTTLHKFNSEFTNPRGQVSIGLVVNSDGSIDAVTPPEYRVQIDDGIESNTTSNIHETDIQLHFWLEDFDTAVSVFRQQVVTELVRAIVLANRQTQTLPEEERLSYEQYLATHIDAFPQP